MYFLVLIIIMRELSKIREQLKMQRRFHEDNFPEEGKDNIWFSAEILSEIFGIDLQSLKRYCKACKIKHSTVEGKQLYMICDVEKLLDFLTIC